MTNNGDPNTWSWQHAILKSSLPPTRRHVLLTLACHMNTVGTGAYPTTATLATETGLSERSVCTHLEHALIEGWITVEKHGFAGRKWRSHQYSAAWPSHVGRPPRPERGTEPASVPKPRGAEPHASEALKQVQSNYPEESSPLISPERR